MPRSAALQLASKRGGELAGKILKDINEVLKWNRLLDSKDENVALKALIYLSNRAYGMPVQANEHAGMNGEAIRVVVEHIGPQNTAPTKAV